MHTYDFCGIVVYLSGGPLLAKTPPQEAVQEGKQQDKTQAEADGLVRVCMHVCMYACVCVFMFKSNRCIHTY